MTQDVLEFSRVFRDELESLMRVCGPLLCDLGDELIALRNHVYLRARPPRVPSQNSFAERRKVSSDVPTSTMRSIEWRNSTVRNAVQVREKLGPKLIDRCDPLCRYTIRGQGNEDVTRLFPGLRRRKNAGW